MTSPTLTVIQADVDALGKALAMPKGAARDQAIESSRTTLENDLGALATNLEQASNGNLVKLATTGFESRQKASQTSDAPAAPTDLHLKTTDTTGEVQVLFGASARAKSYQVQIALDPNNGSWLYYDTFSSSRGIVLKGQPRAKDIWVRVRALGPNNTKSGWSDPATIW